MNLAQKLALLDEPYTPGIVGFLNENKLAVVKVKGEFVWHSHEDTDDLFLVLDGELDIALRDRTVTLGPGELFVVPRGVEHRPCARRGEVKLLLMEPKGTPNTGDEDRALRGSSCWSAEGEGQASGCSPLAVSCSPFHPTF